MKTYLKQIKGECAFNRFESELTAYHEQNFFWTNWVSGWSNPSLLNAYPESFILELTTCNGRQCTWNDAITIVKKLGDAIACTINGRQSQKRNISLTPSVEIDIPQFVSDVIKQWEEKNHPACFRIHGDMKPDNIVEINGEFVVLDWELSRFGTVTEDFGSFVAHALIAEQHGLINQTTILKILKASNSFLPVEVVAALTVTDLLRQFNREQSIGDHKKAALRKNLAQVCIKRWL